MCLFDVADPALGAALVPGGVRALKRDRGIFDTFPISLITTQTVARLGEMVLSRWASNASDRTSWLRLTMTHRSPKTLGSVVSCAAAAITCV